MKSFKNMILRIMSFFILSFSFSNLNALICDFGVEGKSFAEKIRRRGQVEELVDEVSRLSISSDFSESHRSKTLDIARSFFYIRFSESEYSQINSIHYKLHHKQNILSPEFKEFLNLLHVTSSDQFIVSSVSKDKVVEYLQGLEFLELRNIYLDSILLEMDSIKRLFEYVIYINVSISEKIEEIEKISNFIIPLNVVLMFDIFANLKNTLRKFWSDSIVLDIEGCDSNILSSFLSKLSKNGLFKIDPLQYFYDFHNSFIIPEPYRWLRLNMIFLVRYLTCFVDIGSIETSKLKMFVGLIRRNYFEYENVFRNWLNKVQPGDEGILSEFIEVFNLMSSGDSERMDSVSQLTHYEKVTLRDFLY